MLQVHALTHEELEVAARERIETGHGLAREIFRQVFSDGRFAPEEHGLGDRAVRAWRAHFTVELPRVVRVVEEPTDDGRTTAKAVLQTHDGLELECVSIPMGRDRHTLCVSSQVGCKMGCTFCETGRMGLIRSLRADEIVGQVLVAKHVLGWPVRNVVFMGMGEALDQPEVLIQVLRVLGDKCGLAMAQERLTVCTVGSAEGIAQLREADFKRLNLSVSLNAANDALRSAIMPVNRKTPLAALQRELATYRPRRNFTLGVNYCLMPGMNDSRADAQGVAAFCAPIERVLVNVIPYNPGNAPLTPAPSEEEIERFIGWLKAEGLPVRRRVTKGRSVMAACGQLGNVERRMEMRRLRVLPKTDD